MGGSDSFAMPRGRNASLAVLGDGLDRALLSIKASPRRRLGRSLIALLVVAALGVLAWRVWSAPPTGSAGLVQTVALGNTPSGAIVDPQTGHAVITTSDLAGGGSTNGQLFVLDMRTGTILRHVLIGAGPLTVDRASGRVFVTTYGADPQTDGHVVILDARGRLLRVIPSGTFARGVGIDQTRGRVIATSDGSDRLGRVQFMDAATGRLLRSVVVPSGVGTLRVDERDGRVFVVTGQDTISTFDTRTCALLRTVSVGPVPLAPVVDERTGRLFVNSAQTSGTVSVLDARSGRLIRTITVGKTPLDEAVDTRTGRVFVVNQDSNTVSMLDGTSGRVLGTIGVGWKPGTVAVDTAHGRVLVVNYGDGTVSTLDARRGLLVRTVAIGANPSGAALNARAARFLVTTRGPLDAAGNPTRIGQVTVLDTRSGRVLRTLPVGVDPLETIIDERSGRGLVVNSGGTVAVPLSDPWAWVPAGLRRAFPFIPRVSPRVQSTHGSVSLVDAAR